MVKTDDVEDDDHDDTEHCSSIPFRHLQLQVNKPLRDRFATASKNTQEETLGQNL